MSEGWGLTGGRWKLAAASRNRTGEVRPSLNPGLAPGVSHITASSGQANPGSTSSPSSAASAVTMVSLPSCR